MRDNQLIALVGATLGAASAAAGWDYPIVQAFGPTQQGIPSTPTVFFQKLFDEPIGWPQDKYTYNATPNNFTEASIQRQRTTFQVSSLVIQDPSDLTLPTASDVVNYLQQYMAGRATIRQLISSGISAFRVTQVRNDYFEDDRHRFEAHPNFDIVFTYDQEVDFIVPAAQEVDGATYPNIEPSGGFPV